MHNVSSGDDFAGLTKFAACTNACVETGNGSREIIITHMILLCLNNNIIIIIIILMT